MKKLILPILLSTFILFCDKKTEFDDSVPEYYLGLLQKHARGSQVILVESENMNQTKAHLLVFEKKKNWKQVMDIPVVLGKNGFSHPGEKREGDGKSPSGVFDVGEAFGYESKIETRLHYIQSKPDDYWVDDVSSKDYNRRVKGKPKGSAEKLLRKDHLYKYGLVVKYNTDPVIPGKGSAIFLHIWRSENSPTAGCIAMKEKDIINILKWLDPKKNPRIIMGTTKDLTSL